MVAEPGLRGDSRLRRGVDLVVAVVGLVLFGPALVALGVIVRTTSTGPAIFRQVRVGRGGRPFVIWKFRTMLSEAPALGPAVSGAADPRVTGFGRWLRRHRLDELPQLVNLARGDLTLIGPRPEVREFVEHYTEEELQLLQVRPGVVGPGAILFAAHQAAQLDVVGDPGAHYVDHQLHDKLALDLDYVRNRSLARDLRVLARTLVAVA